MQWLVTMEEANNEPFYLGCASAVYSQARIQDLKHKGIKSRWMLGVPGLQVFSLKHESSLGS
jgi:hypothetical protein